MKAENSRDFRALEIPEPLFLDDKYSRMRLIFLILSFFVASFAFAQKNEPEVYKTFLSQFTQTFNNARYREIFQWFSPDMKKALPEANTVDFFTGLFTQGGKIRHLEYEGSRSGNPLYKAVFDRTVYSFLIVLDKNNEIAGFRFTPYVPDNLPVIARNSTKLSLPFNDTWTVFWGGDTEEQNYHVESEAQKNAFDLVITDAGGRSYRNEGKVNEDYYAFGKELLSPCDGEVVLVVDGIKDNVPGESNPVYVPGNTVIIRTAANEFLFFAHFRQHSIKVRQGDKVQRDQLLGLCGNSGNSSEPHLHFHIQNVENMNVATGVKCFFDQIKVNDVVKKDYSPVKGEKVQRVR